MIITTLIAFVVSYRVSGLPFNVWYHDILLCGVDKVSMNITTLSHLGAEDPRKWWMIFFEGWFGICIKFVCPGVFMYMISESLKDDLAVPFGSSSAAI